MQGRQMGRRAEGRTRLGWTRTLPTKVLDAIRRIAGMPDYCAYLAHVRHCHPEAEPMTERQFYHEFVRARYGDGPTRCC
jgi:uncharacterized short protein YbdD (DUF466 family)